MILRVGLTGGIASGKSTVLRLFRELGCLTVDADSIVSQLYRPGRAGYAALLREYGKSILGSEGEIDRVRLASIAFSSQESASRLNALIHPLVIEEEKKLFESAASTIDQPELICVVEATLLLESGGRSRYDRIVVVDVDPAVQRSRAAERGMTPADAERRMAHQMARQDRLHLCDYVIDNNGDLAATRESVLRVYNALMQDLEEKKKAPS